ncbi:hypothetical protein EC973_007711 [Apophysomyces ossiformis]|uniref:Kinesin-like protein n=1 Tax=Apophysomyces ossiformis TaxID=679940 RepID=A0A8H7EVD7_9FUNG|nr:hypothetical protein EC973_007711 [Apophysomyces ossiformis]
MGTESEPGVIPRAVNEVFEYIKRTISKEFLLRVSYLEIYNETIRDLLAPETDNIKIHEDKRRGIYVSPLVEEVVTSPKEVIQVIQKGEANRHISTTDYNLHSSRSHTIFQMVIESRKRNDNSTTLKPGVPHRRLTSLSGPGRMESLKISQLNLIDLAGSEKAVSNQERRKEGAFINKSLLTLGTVISKLTESGKSSHIPYRDSKLTRILQTALSGLAKVVVICTISPSAGSLEESHNTLKFAGRVKKIVVSAKNEEVMDDKALIQKYRGEIIELKEKLEAANEVLQKEKENTQSMLSAERHQYEQELRQMRLVRAALKERINYLSRLILSSSSVVTLPTKDIAEEMAVIDKELTTTGTSGTEEEDPWKLVRNLKRELEQVTAQKTSAESQCAVMQTRIESLEKEIGQYKGLVDKVAHLEAELSVTKAELQVTSLMSKGDKQSSSKEVNTAWETVKS